MAIYSSKVAVFNLGHQVTTILEKKHLPYLMAKKVEDLYSKVLQCDIYRLT